MADCFSRQSSPGSAACARNCVVAGEWEQGRRGGLAGGAATAQQAQRLQRYFYRYMTRWTTTRLPPLSAVLMNDASQPHSRHLNCLLVDHRVSNKHVSGRNSGPIPPVFEPIRSTSRTTKFFDKFVGYRCIVASHHLLFRQGLVMGTVTSTHQSLGVLLLRINY